MQNINLKKNSTLGAPSPLPIKTKYCMINSWIKMEKCNIVSGKDIWRNKKPKNARGKKTWKQCQKWDLNPRPLSRTRTWVWRLRPLGHPDFVNHLIQIYYIDNYYYLVSQNLRYAIIWKMIKIHFRNTKSFKIQYLQHTYIEF